MEICTFTPNSSEKPETAPVTKDTNAKSFCFTLNNYTDEDVKILTSAVENKKCDYVIFGYEKGEEGTEHLQGYLFKKSKLRFSALKKLLPRAHWEVCKGTPAQNIKYCSKQGNFLEFGDTPGTGQGKRNDLKEFMDTIDSGERNKLVLMRKHPEVMAKYPKFAQDYKNQVELASYQPPDIQLREWEKTVFDQLQQDPIPRRIYWIWSPESKTGKSTFMQYVMGIMKNQVLTTSELNRNNILYAYDSHKVIHINLARDITQDQKNFLDSTLELLSDGGLQMSGKYESTMKNVKAHIVVTSNQPPDLDRLPYRFYEVRLFSLEDKSRLADYKITNHS